MVPFWLGVTGWSPGLTLPSSNNERLIGAGAVLVRRLFSGGRGISAFDDTCACRGTLGGAVVNTVEGTVAEAGAGM